MGEIDLVEAELARIPKLEAEIKRLQKINNANVIVEQAMEIDRLREGLQRIARGYDGYDGYRLDVKDCIKLAKAALTSRTSND